jgi:hypothetical protein
MEPPMAVRVQETTPLAEASVTPSGRMLVHAITAGLGSSGYYSPDVLREAASAELIAKGTPLFLDHPSDSEAQDRPERSVRDIAAVFTRSATYDETNQALVGEIQVFAPYRDLLVEMAPHIGLSIRGSATDVTEGEVDGRRVPIIEGLRAIDSVDWVTKAGRGGKVVALLESARAMRSNPELVEEQVADMSAAIHMQRSILSDLRGELTELREVIANHVPATRPDSTTTTKESEEVPMGQIQIDEAEHQRLVEAAGRVDTLATERDTEKARADAAEQQLAEAKKTARPKTPREVMEARDSELRNQVATLAARERARDIIAEELAEAWLPGTTVARLSSELLESLPLVEEKLDEQALRGRVVDVRDQHELEAAEALTAAGVGTPRGLGSLRPAGRVDESATEDALKGAFQSFGLSESAAETAAKGR